MSEYKVIGIIAHVDAGKTTLSEALLYTAGEIKKLGRVDRQDAFLDNFEMERKRGITIFSKCAVLNDITLLDTPGHMDFQAEMERTMSVLDYCILVISGAAKLDTHTITLLKLLLKRQIPVFVFINKMDMEGADSRSIINSLNELTEPDFVRFSEYIKGSYNKENSRPSNGRDEVRDRVSLLFSENNLNREQFFENIATCDEELLNEYMETGSIDDDRIREMIVENKLVPVFEGAALKNVGVREFYEGILKFTLDIEYPSEKDFTVYKISRDDKEQKLTHVKVTGGEWSVRDIIDGEKITEIRIYSGEKYESVRTAHAGQLAVFMGLNNQEFHEEEEIVPVMTYSLKFDEGKSIHEVLPKLRILQEEEPSLNLEVNGESNEIQVRIFGKVQMEILKSIIEKRFNLNVEFEDGRILYKETIEDEVEGAGHFEPLRHYAEVHLRMTPLERGSGIQIKTECSVDDLSLNWQRLIFTHLQEKEFRGVLTGSPITDICFTLVAGRAHIKHTEGGDFREAVYRAVRQGLMKAKSVLLEPYCRFSLTLPTVSVGRALSDLEQKGATAAIEAQDEENTVITGRAPVSQMQSYQMEVVTYTKGAGSLNLVMDGYDRCKNADEIILERGYDPDADISNPAGSVFCSHGAGVYVPWDEADSHMHIQTEQMISDEPIEKKLKRIQEDIEKYRTTEDELNAIFKRTFGSNSSNARPKRKYKLHRNYSEKKVAGGNTYNSKEDYEKIRKKKKAEGKRILLVDGYNVIYAWEDLSELAKVNLESARGKLADELCNYAAYKGLELILVFDAYKVKGNLGEMQDYHNIHVVYTQEAQTADEYIGKTAISLGSSNSVTVATSDNLVQLIIRGNNCNLLSSNELRERIEDANEEMQAKFGV